MSGTLTASGVALGALAFAIYFLPAIIAAARRHAAANGVTAVNLLLGWTILGWIAALAWALNAAPSIVVAASSQPEGGRRLPCPFCAEPILPAATTCRFCGRQLPQKWSSTGHSSAVPPRSVRVGKALARRRRRTKIAS